MSRELSPIDVEILWKRSISAVDEAVASLVQTSYSSVVRDFHDYACAVFDAQGRMLAQSTHSTPGLLGILPFTIPNFLKSPAAKKLRPGDVLVTNDPWLASGHLIDITVATPIFRHSEICAYALCVVHHLNVGGRPVTLASRDLYEEGLKIPVMHLFREGEPVDLVFDFIRSNVREPDKVTGDIRAQVAANFTASQKIVAMMDSANLDSLDVLTDEIINRSEASMRQVISELPDGEYDNSLDLLNVAGLEEPIHLEVNVKIKGNEIHIDYAGTSKQVPRAVNVTLNMTRSYSVYLIKCMLDPTVPNNAGCLHPIVINAPEGSVLNATFPAATWGRTIISHMLPELLTSAMANIAPDRAIASSGSCPLWSGHFMGRYKSGQTFYVTSCFNGGMGARAERDGLSTTCFPANVASVPIEIIEADTAIRFTKKMLSPGSFGAGKYRGGAGQIFGFEIADDRDDLDGPAIVSVRGGRLGIPIRGLFGGENGGEVVATFNDEDVPLGTHLEMHPGDRMEIHVPGGAGYGNPLERDRNLVLKDVRNGMLTPEDAERIYNVTDLSNADQQKKEVRKPHDKTFFLINLSKQGGKKMKLLQHKLFIGIASAFLASSVFAAMPAKAEQKFLTLTAGGNAGSWYVGSTIISEIVNKNVAETTMTPQPGGGVSNMKKLQAEKVEFGYMMTSTMAEAMNGVGTFEKPHGNLRAVMALAPMYNQLVVRVDSGISSYEDLSGKRMSPGKKGFSTAANFDKTMSAMGTSVEALEDAGGSVSYLDYSDAGQNMRDGLLDAVFVTGVIPFSLYSELSATVDIKFVPMSDKLMSSYVAKNQGWSKGGIPAGSYDNDAEIPTVVTYMGLATHASVPDDVVYNVTKAIFENKQKLADGYPAYRGLGPKVFINDSLNGLPMHPGAEKFWKEQGLM